jgi:PAS domain S-box-containing protein
MTKKIDINWLITPAFLTVLFFAGLYMADTGSFLLFHSIAETFSVVVAVGIFMFAWNSRDFLDNDFFLLLGIAYLFVGIIDFFHMMTYSGMGVMSSGDANTCAQTWIAARLIEAVSLVISAKLIGKKINVNLALVIYSAVASIFMLSIFYWGNFPECYSYTAGLTAFKIVCEYVISVILLIAMFLLFRKKEKFDEKIYHLLITAIFFTILTELLFTLYVELTGFLNVLGHVLKIISFYLIYKAIISTGYKNPYKLLFRELKVSQDAVRKEKDFVENILNTAQAIVLVLDTGGRIVRFNPYLEKISGYKLEEVLGRDWFSTFVPGQEKENVRQRLMQSVNNMDSNCNISQIVTKEGKILDIEWSVKSLKDSQDNTVGLLAIGHDITISSRILGELQESETKFRQLFLAESDAIVVFDEETKEFTDMNDAAITLYGYSPEEFMRLKITDISEDTGGVFPDTGEIFIGRILEQSVRYHKKKNGERFPAEISMGKFSWRGRKMICQIVRDITDRERMEKELLDRNRELTNFAYMVSHDLKSPLNLITGYLEMIREEPELFNECYGTVMRQAEEMAELIDSLLQLSRAGKVIDQREKTNVKNLISTVYCMVKPEKINTELVFITDLPDIMGDPDRLSQVFKNLFTNSIQHYDPDKDKLTLEISHEMNGSHMVLRYRDNGSGINREVMEKIFDSGFTHGKKSGKGTGFGLTIVKKVVEAHGGEVWANSGGEKKGVEFFLKFPVDNSSS